MALSVWAGEDEIVKYIGTHYGADIAAFLRIPELRKLILAAAHGEWAPELVSTKLRRTAWYRNRSESMRTMDALKVADPKQYAALVNNKYSELRAEFIAQGLPGSKAMAETALRMGWTPEKLREEFSEKLTAQSRQSGFSADSQPDVTADKLMAIARNEYLSPVDRQTAERWAVKAYQTGIDQEDAFRSYLSTLSGARFGIDPTSGITPSDVMAPARVAIAENLEMNPEQIDFLDPEYSDVLQVETSDGRFRPMTAHEATVWARSRDSFKNTQKAEDETATLVEQLGKTFGKVG